MVDEIQPPWGQFDYEAWHDSWAVQAMSWKEAGLYFQLLALQWKHGAIPADPRLCGRMIGVGSSGPEYEEFERAFEVVVEQFDPVENDPSKLRNARQAKERKKAVAAIEQKIAAGKASGKSRRSNKNERPFNERSNGRSTDAATDIDVRDRNTSSVSTKPAEPGVENSREEGPWNARLAPTARKLGGEENVSRWLRWGRDNPDLAERVMLGVLSLRDRGAIDYCAKPGEPCTPGILDEPYEGQPVRRYAEHEYFRVTRPERKGPRRTNGGPERLTTEGVA